MWPSKAIVIVTASLLFFMSRVGYVMSFLVIYDEYELFDLNNLASRKVNCFDLMFGFQQSIHVNSII